MVRTRIAPSPTGLPHIGTIYQAFFNFAYARRLGGSFIVRIEDTDRDRLVEESEKKIFEALDWFDLQEDESPRKKEKYGLYRQSERLELYKKYSTELIEKGKAYYCFCTKERLEKVRKEIQLAGKVPMYDKHCRSMSKEEVKNKLLLKTAYVVRLKVPENVKIAVQDEIRGEIVFDSNSVDDQILLKSDGFPTYHLAVVVDDHLMEITHVVRGEEWISSFPKHSLLYKYFGWKMPLFFHTPLLRNPDKSKLGKRHGHTNVDWYKKQGYLPATILNFLALLGWSHPQQKEIFSVAEFIRLFDLKDLKPIAPTFDLQKLEWMNGEYIRKFKSQKLKVKIKEFIGGKYSEDVIEKTIPLIQERIKKLSDYLPMCGFFFAKPKIYELDLTGKKELLKNIQEELNRIDDWQADKIGLAMQDLARKLNVKNSEFFMSLRVAVSGKKITPPLNDSMQILGKEECLERIKKLT